MLDDVYKDKMNYATSDIQEMVQKVNELIKTIQDNKIKVSVMCSWFVVVAVELKLDRAKTAVRLGGDFPGAALTAEAAAAAAAATPAPADLTAVPMPMSPSASDHSSGAMTRVSVMALRTTRTRGTHAHAG